MNLIITLTALVACLAFTWKWRISRRPSQSFWAIGFAVLGLSSAYCGSDQDETELANRGLLRQAVAIHCAGLIKSQGPLLVFIPPNSAPEIRATYDAAIAAWGKGDGLPARVVEVESLALGQGFSLECFRKEVKEASECRLILTYAGLPKNLSDEECRELLAQAKLVQVEGATETALNLQRAGAPIPLVLVPAANAESPPPGSFLEGSSAEICSRYFQVVTSPTHVGE
ncbi:MAG: hypothetical protein RL095_151 [Verrucomicrobiota bacterium]